MEGRTARKQTRSSYSPSVHNLEEKQTSTFCCGEIATPSAYTGNETNNVRIMKCTRADYSNKIRTLMNAVRRIGLSPCWQHRSSGKQERGLSYMIDRIKISPESSTETSKVVSSELFPKKDNESSTTTLLDCWKYEEDPKINHHP